MLLRKNLPPIREPRLYLSMERSYLSLIKFVIVAFGAGILARKFAMALRFFHLEHLHPFFIALYQVLTIPAVVVLFAIIPFFWNDLRYVAKGPSVSAKEMDDPRVHFSAERTFLSWIRTALSSIAFAFVLAKFDFLLRKFSALLHVQIPLLHRLTGSNTIFLAFGLVLLALAFWGLLGTQASIREGTCRLPMRRYLATGLILVLLGIGMLRLLWILGWS
ncbi:DUF202 domain-containing protein [Acidithiobacillus sp. AMEEHan]|uniref:YidH family protein n=1 Tax=Acidithiobacillus sp. AMEEHan TaxID=2994951 RepID=UPI0027E58C6E|nr:DUF202 domain-containing protein [Acidithiobacillus sp. AMEEHan]